MTANRGAEKKIKTEVDAVLILSFGGPEGPDDVLEFLRNVTRGRNVPDERLAEVAEQYALFGGRSPINDQCRALARALSRQLSQAGLGLPVYFGTRNWHPYIVDTVGQMANDGIRRAVVFVTSAFGNYSGCRQYQEDVAAARDAVEARHRSNGGPPAPDLEKLRLFYNHPGFIDPMVDSVWSGLNQLNRGNKVRVLFSAHSIPQTMAAGCHYETQLAEAAGLIMERLPEHRGGGYDIVYQSRSGPPQVLWLEPDINDHLTTLAAGDVDGVVVVPLGFTSDHMEVLFDLDTQAAATAERLGLAFVRVPTVGTDKRYVAMINELINEVRFGQAPVAVGQNVPWPAPCPPDHCPAPTKHRR